MKGMKILKAGLKEVPHTLLTTYANISFDEVVFMTLPMRDAIALRMHCAHVASIPELETRNFLQLCLDSSVKVIDKRKA